MTAGLIMTLLLGFAVLAGMLIIKRSKNHERIESLSVALAFGAMLGIALFDLGPEMAETWSPRELWIPGLLILLGIGLLVLLDRFIPDHDEGGSGGEENMVHIGIMSAMAIILHNILEGMTVCSVALSSLVSGISLCVGVALHNIPMGMLIYTTLRREHGIKKYGILLLACGSTFAGGLLMALLHGLIAQRVLEGLVAIALGMVLYILIFELLPSVRHMENRACCYIGTAVGLLAVLAAAFLE